MKIYMLRRDLLPENWSLDTILAMTEEQMAAEMNRQLDLCLEQDGKEDNFIAIYDFVDFEDLINLSGKHAWEWNPSDYYIRFFNI